SNGMGTLSSTCQCRSCVGPHQNSSGSQTFTAFSPPTSEPQHAIATIPIAFQSGGCCIAFLLREQRAHDGKRRRRFGLYLYLHVSFLFSCGFSAKYLLAH